MEVDILKAVLIFLPIVFSHAGRSDSTLVLLEAGSFNLDPHIQELFPQENWDQLISSSFKACELAITAKGDDATIRESGVKIGTSSRGRGLDTTKSWMNKRPFKWILQAPLFRLGKDSRSQST